MLNLGFIGDIKLLEPYIKRIQKNSKIHIVGKSSIGVKSNDDFRFSVPEFNRFELIERSDILVINHFSLLPFNLISKAVKKGKHIFASDYPDYSIHEFEELAKLAKEADIVFQFSNPLFNHPAVHWLKNNIKPPAYWDITCYKKDNKKDELLISVLMMLQGMINGSPKKISASAFKSPAVLSEFINLRIDFGNAAIVNLNSGSLPSDEFTIKAFASGMVVSFNFFTKNFTYNKSKIDPGRMKSTDEFNKFIENTLSKKHQVTEIDDYLKVLQNMTLIRLKLSQFSDS
jgi:hypothetical protein